MKMGNIVPRAGIKPTSLAFQVSVLPSHHVGSMTPPCPPVYAAPCFRGQCRLLHSSPWSVLMHTARSLHRIQLTETSVVSEMKMGNIVQTTHLSDPSCQITAITAISSDNVQHVIISVLILNHHHHIKNTKTPN